MGISFIVLPLVGIILYFFFGRRTRKNRNIWQKSLDQLTKRSMIEFAEQKQLELSTDYQRLIQAFYESKFGITIKKQHCRSFMFRDMISSPALFCNNK